MTLSSKIRQTCNSIAEETAIAVIKYLKLEKQLKGKEISVVITDDPTIQSLNRTYRKKDYATNVLSFPYIRFKHGDLAEKVSYTNVIGEVVLSYEKCKEEAEEQNKPVNHHLTHLMIHSYLHLFGYDHEKKRDAERMEEIEIKILKKDFGIKNPYIS